MTPEERDRLGTWLAENAFAQSGTMAASIDALLRGAGILTAVVSPDAGALELNHARNAEQLNRYELASYRGKMGLSAEPPPEEATIRDPEPPKPKLRCRTPTRGVVDVEQLSRDEAIMLVRGLAAQIKRIHAGALWDGIAEWKDGLDR